MSDAAELKRLLGALVTWAQSEADVRAIALVGSWARGVAREDSDIDLIVLARTPDVLVREMTWTTCVGTPSTVDIEDWGAIRSVRVHYSTGAEVEYGIGSLEWAGASPADSGTSRVIRDGVVSLYDPDSLIANLEASVGDERAGAADLRGSRIQACEGSGDEEAF